MLHLPSCCSLIFQSWKERIFSTLLSGNGLFRGAILDSHFIHPESRCCLTRWTSCIKKYFSFIFIALNPSPLPYCEASLSKESFMDGTVSDRNFWRNDRKQHLFVLDPDPSQPTWMRMSWMRLWGGVEQEENGRSGKNLCNYMKRNQYLNFKNSGICTSISTSCPVSRVFK